MRIFIAICTAFAVGLHLVLLQGIAWIGMAVTYTQEEGSLMGGLSKTFDGEHPCGLCEVIQAERERSAERDDPAAPSNHQEIKVTQMQLVSSDWQLPQFPAATFGRHPARLGEPWSVATSPLEKPPQTV